MLVVTREGDRRCKLRPSQRAMVAVVSYESTPHWRRSTPGSGPASPPPTPTPARSSTCSPTSTGPAQDAARARSRLHPARRNPRRVRPGRRRPGRLLPQTPAPRSERAGRHRPGRPAAVAFSRPAGPYTRPDRRPHPPDHPDLRAPGRSHPGRSRLPRRRTVADDRHQTQAAPGPHSHRKTVNRALAAARPLERGVAMLKSWRIFRRSRCSPNRMRSIVKAILTLGAAALEKLSERFVRR